MSAKEKAPTREATRAEAAETAAYGRAAISNSHHSTATEVRQIQISDFLLHGAENAVPRCHLRQLTGFSDRELRRRIQEERLAGVPILSDNQNGYFLPENEQELRYFVRSMRSRAKEIEAVAAAVEGADV